MLADVGEERLLAALAASTPAGPGVVIGPGDDAAVLTAPAAAALVMTQDVLVEGVDFQRDWTTPHLVGRKALVLSLSDLAGMGARPLWCVAAVCAPPRTRVDDLLAVHAGLLDAAEEGACALVGGDLSAIDGPLVVDVCAVGATAPETVLRRDAGRPGDLLAVTGRLGRAAAGLRRLLDGAGPPAGGVAQAVAASADAVSAEVAWYLAQVRPRARVAEGMALAAAGVRCAGDVSDGLVVDASRTAAASGCGAELWLDRLPVDDELRDRFGAGWPDLALGGGEDFELLVAAPPVLLPLVTAAWSTALAPLTVVGRLVEGTGLRVLESEGGAPVPTPAPRSRHFT